MAEFEDVLTNQPVVIDNVRQTVLLSAVSFRSLTVLLNLQGSGTIKAGFAGQDHPKCFFPSLCVCPVRAVLRRVRAISDMHVS